MADTGEEVELMCCPRPQPRASRARPAIQWPARSRWPTWSSQPWRPVWWVRRRWLSARRAVQLSVSDAPQHVGRPLIQRPDVQYLLRFWFRDRDGQTGNRLGFVAFDFHLAVPCRWRPSTSTTWRATSLPDAPALGSTSGPSTATHWPASTPRWARSAARSTSSASVSCSWTSWTPWTSSWRDRRTASFECGPSTTSR
jgi:hypothetical protein